MLADSLKPDFIVFRRHMKNKHNVNFYGYYIIRDCTNTGAVLLVSKDYEFEVVINRLLTSYTAAILVQTTDVRQLLVVFM